MALFSVRVERKYVIIKSSFHYDMQPLSKEICYLPFPIPNHHYLCPMKDTSCVFEIKGNLSYLWCWVKEIFKPN